MTAPRFRSAKPGVHDGVVRRAVLNLRKRRVNAATSIDDLQRMAHRAVPKPFMDYFEAGSYSQSTLAANRKAFTALDLRQRVLTGVGKRQLATRVLGEQIAMPVVTAPIGMMGMAWRDGEIAMARAAAAAGIPFTLSTMSVCSIEDVAQAVGTPFWFQLYVMKNRDFIAALIERAKSARCSALVLTVDLQTLAQRHCDIKNGVSVPPAFKLKTLMHLAARPGWVARVLTGKRKTFGNLVGHIAGAGGAISLARWAAEQFDQGLDWSDVAWIKQAWGGKLVIKGIMDADDALKAVDLGADAIVVSNHGGRQLDGAPASIDALPAIVAAVGGSATEVLVDGGIRSGQDVFRALGRGATACMLGRAPLYGLSAGGEAGVSRALAIIRSELDVTMALTGQPDASRIDRAAVLS